MVLFGPYSFYRAFGLGGLFTIGTANSSPYKNGQEYVTTTTEYWDYWEINLKVRNHEGFLIQDMTRRIEFPKCHKMVAWMRLAIIGKTFVGRGASYRFWCY